MNRKRVITPRGREMMFYGDGPWDVTLNEETGRCVGMGHFSSRADAEQALADAENYLGGAEAAEAPGLVFKQPIKRNTRIDADA